MPGPRLHLFELGDRPWFSAAARDPATDYLHFMETAFQTPRPVAPLLAGALRFTKADHVVDLCSGGAGPAPPLRRAPAAEGPAVRFTLADRFPNVPAPERAAASTDAISSVTEAVDARPVPPGRTGFRTLFNAFHHVRPDDAVAVLRDAARAGQPTGVFEIPDRRLSTLLPLLLLAPLLVGVATPFIRPFRWRRPLRTCLVLLAPLTCWRDGVVSELRAHTVAEPRDWRARWVRPDARGKRAKCRSGRSPAA